MYQVVSMCINRNILECKDQPKRILFWLANGINRNILECKVDLCSVNQSSHPGINRNILECKVFLAVSDIQLTYVLIETYWNVKENTSELLQYRDVKY